MPSSMQISGAGVNSVRQLAQILRTSRWASTASTVAAMRNVGSPMSRRRLLAGIVPLLQGVIGHAQLLEVELDDRAVEDPQGDALAEQGGQGRDPDIPRVGAQGELEPAVLRGPALGDVEVRHDLNAAGDRR